MASAWSPLAACMRGDMDQASRASTKAPRPRRHSTICARRVDEEGSEWPRGGGKKLLASAVPSRVARGVAEPMRSSTRRPMRTRRRGHPESTLPGDSPALSPPLARLPLALHSKPRPRRLGSRSCGPQARPVIVRRESKTERASRRLPWPTSECPLPAATCKALTPSGPLSLAPAPGEHDWAGGQRVGPCGRRSISPGKSSDDPLR